MSYEYYRREAIRYYYENLNTFDKTDYKYRDCLKKLEWLLRDDKSTPIAVLDKHIIRYCKECLDIC